MKKDPYRWLEGNSERVNTWLSKEEQITKDYFKNNKVVSSFKKRFAKLFQTDSMLLPTVRGELYFYRMRKPKEQAHSLYVRKGLTGKPRLLLDSKRFSNTYGLIQDWNVSKDGKYICINFSKAGNDKSEIRVFDVQKRKFLIDIIPADRYPYFSSWKLDMSGFWYVQGAENAKPGEEKLGKMVYFHRLGDKYINDSLFFGQNLDKTDWPLFGYSQDGKHVLINIRHRDDTTTILFNNLELDSPFTEIAKGIGGKSFALFGKGYIYLITDHKAPNRKILRKKIENNSLDKWETIIPETKHFLNEMKLMNDCVFIEYIINVHSTLWHFDLNTLKKRQIQLPGIGCITGMSGEFEGKELFYGFSAFNIPPSNYRLELHPLFSKLFWTLKLPLKNIDIAVKQEWCISKDGTKIPMFIVHKRNLNLNKLNPTLVYAYGGFSSSQFPAFNTSIIPFIEDGGVYVLANIRGGAEFGEQWHKSVILTKRKKVFADFAAVLRHLVQRKYTNPQKIAIWGGSNGGLLVSGIMLQYPDLFKTALIAVPVTDMLRYHKFNGGRWWISEYGDPSNPKMAKYLMSYSPYHNVRKENYPSAMFITSDQDDRVHPMHTYKMVAKLKESRNQTNPIIMRLERKAGHSGAAKLTPTIERLSDMFAFIYQELGI